MTGLQIDAVESVVRLATGLSAIEIEALRSDEDYWIVSVKTASDGLIVKLATSPVVPSFENAQAKHELIRANTKIPMSRVIAADDSASTMPFRYSIQTRLLGEEWFARRDRLDEVDRERALAGLGDVVGQLHQVQLPRFGTLPEPREEACLTALMDHSRMIIRDRGQGAQFIELLERNADLWAGAITPSFTHEDLHGFNVLFHHERPTEVSGILDFDKAWSGPPESDIARMELWRGMSGPSFFDAYRKWVPQLPGYEHRRPLYQLLWCLEYAQNTREHLETTNSLLARLGLSQLQSF